MTQIATPERIVEVKIEMENGKFLLYNAVRFLPIAKALLFNGLNSSVNLDKDRIVALIIEDRKYIMNDISVSDGGSLVRLSEVGV